MLTYDICDIKAKKKPFCDLTPRPTYPLVQVHDIFCSYFWSLPKGRINCKNHNKNCRYNPKFACRTIYIFPVYISHFQNSCQGLSLTKLVLLIFRRLIISPCLTDHLPSLTSSFSSGHLCFDGEKMQTSFWMMSIIK